MDRGPQPITPSIEADKAPVKQLTRSQRRVLGVLVEKAFTTPETYPLTLKAVTTGCNQKSNRSPVTSYSEEAVEEALDELRKLGLVAVVHTESGRTERYRHFMRQRYPFSEPQLAIITELLLRGRQQPGELRSRASRMAPIETLEELRSDLQALTEQGYVQSNGPLDRRGVEVDHTFHVSGERPDFSPRESAETDSESPRSSNHASLPDSGGHSGRASSAGGSHRSDPPHEYADLRAQLQETRETVDALKDEVAQLRDAWDALRRDLGA